MKQILDDAEIVDFGVYLNSLGDGAIFEAEDAEQRFEAISRDEAIKRFQDFYDKRTSRFKIRLTYRMGDSLQTETREIVRANPN